MDAPRESSVVAAILKMLKKLPRCRAHKTHGGPYGNSGEPDIDICLLGQCIKMEVKTGDITPTPLQLRVIEQYRSAGAIAGVVYSVEEAEILIRHGAFAIIPIHKQSR